MLSRRSRAAAGFILAISAGLFALPACGKKKDAGDDNPAPGPNAGGTPNAPKGRAGLTKMNAGLFQTSQDNLKQIGMALHNFLDTHSKFPAGIYGPDGKTLGLSWRVAILPYLEQGNLYKAFKMNEPWDSSHNKSLIDQMPRVFAAPGGSVAGLTFTRSFTGPGTAMSQQPGAPRAAGQLAYGLGIAGIGDGFSNTALVAEGAEAVTWTKPDELVFSPKGPLPKLGGVFIEGTNVLMGDGSRRFFSYDIPENTLRAVITAAGGEVVDLP